MHWEIEMEEELVSSTGLCKGTIKLTIEVLAFDLFTMANSPFQLSWYIYINKLRRDPKGTCRKFQRKKIINKSISNQ